MPLRTLALASLAAGAAANHLAGPMQDRMNACMADKCAAFSTFQTAANFAGTGMTFAAFTSPPMNSVPFIYDMDYALTAMGFKSGNFSYRAVQGAPQNLTADSSSYNHTDVFSCMCDKCGSTLEAIFQPVGRMICTMVGYNLPCQTEFDACTAANGVGTGATGSLAGGDLKYPAAGGGGNRAKGASVCHPEAAFYGYQVGWNLTADCNCAGTALKAGGGTTALALAKCVSTSRMNAYNATMNTLKYVGPATCPAPNCPAAKQAGAATAALSAAAASAVLLAASL
eukprot:COSAG01_NODE_13011_length_1649_cov_2.258065_1_plen_284_part_00